MNFWNDESLNEVDYAAAAKSEPLPAGDYVVICKSFEERISKASGDKYFNASLKVADGPLKGRYAFISFFVNNKTNLRFARQEQAKAKDFALATGHLPKDNGDLAGFENKALVVSLKVSKGTNGYADSNSLVKCKPYSGPLPQEPSGAGGITLDNDVPF